MSDVNYMSMEELVELKNQWYDLWVKYECPDFRENALAISEEITRREMEEEQKEVTINVLFQTGYRWSVDINGGESINTGLTKTDAMALARKLKNNFEKAIINEQKLTKEERKKNISYLHENTYSYNAHIAR